MNRNNDYKIKNVSITTNGRNELYFNVDWDGDKELDAYELRIWEGDKENCLEVSFNPDHSQRIVVKDHCFVNCWQSKSVNKQNVLVELGIAEYTEDGEEFSWKVLAAYKAIELNVYYEFHLFRKNVIELRQNSCQ